jgi:hypothetical protein
MAHADHSPGASGSAKVRTVSLTGVTAPAPTVRAAALVGSVVTLGLALAWAFLSMRAVMVVGGSCADGGPYVSAQSCPSGAGFIGLAIPLMLVAAFVGSFAAGSLSAPNLLVPMWAGLFGALGWNFLEYGVTRPGGAVWGWISCGVVFWLMALPAVFVIALGVVNVVAPRAGAAIPRGGRRWWVLYPALGAAGVALGVLSFNAMT